VSYPPAEFSPPPTSGTTGGDHTVMNKRSMGSEGEQLAARFLQEKGYEIIERNYRFGRGEMDLIAKEGNDLVFIEVKARRSSEYGAPEESITVAKEAQLKRVADGYLSEHDIEDQNCRFDIVTITYEHGAPVINLIQNVFLG
jgi:putative endonuclease